MLPFLSYHKVTTQFFQQKETVWKFFADQTYKDEQLKEFKADLLKNTYKFDELSDDASLYAKTSLAREKLGLRVPVTLYQAQNTEDINASIVYLNGEAHIVFSGKLIQMLDEDEQLAIISHELSHVHLYTQLNGNVEVTDRIVTAIANHQCSSPAHYETARLFKLYTEIFCDRGAYNVTGSYKPIISSLVKISTGLQTVNADSYIKQAEDIFTLESAIKTTGISHPENFIRARAIWLWHTKGNQAEPEIQRMIEGQMNLDELDLFQQQQLTSITEQLIKLILHPQWIQTSQTIALGKQYFGRLEIDIVPDKIQLSSRIERLHTSLHDYLAYVLYDFATSDKALEDVPLGYCFSLADELKIDKSFENAVKKERKLTDKKTTILKKQTLGEFHKHNLQTV